jgi:PAS domain S-box-containing protein
MRRNKNRSLGEYEVIIFSVIIGLSAYVIDAEVDAFIFLGGSFPDMLIFAVPFGKLYIRLYALASFIIFGVFVSRMLAKRKKTEEVLRDSERRYRNLIETAPEVIYTFSAEDGRITSVNPAFEKLTGWSRNEWLGKSFAPIIHPDDLPLAMETFQKILHGETQSPYELRVLSKSGEYLVGEFTSMPQIENGKIVGEFGIIRDITERKHVELALEQSEEKYRRQFEEALDAIFLADAQTGIILDCNRAATELVGREKSELIGKHQRILHPPDEIKGEFSRTFRQHLKEKMGQVLETQVITKNGEIKEVAVKANVFELGGKRIIQGIFRDITERKIADEALQESEERFRSVVENSHNGILMVDDNFRLIYANDELCRIFGYSREEIVGQDFRKFLDKDSVSLCQGMYLRRQRGEKVPSLYELRMVRKDGEKRDVEIKATIVRDSQGKVQSVVQILDITTQKRMEEERRRYEERLSALNLYGGKLNTANNLQQVYELTLDAMEKTLGFEDATFMVVERGCLKVVCQRGYPKPILLALPLDGTKKGITVRAASTRKPFLVPDVKKDKDYVAGVPGIQSELGVPVIAEDRVLGVLDVESRELGAFDEKDVTLLQILASHAATAISNLERRKEIENRSNQITSLMKSSTDMIHSTGLRQRLQKIAEAIKELGWRRAVIRLTDKNMETLNPQDVVTAGLMDEEIEYLWNNRQPGQVWRERFGPKYARFRIGEFYHFPWSDPWVREEFSKGTIPSKLSPEEMVDWDPQDLLYAPLRLADGRIVGVVSIDDPLDGRRPTKESLAPLELFLHQAAVAIENAKLIQQLDEAKKEIKEYANQLEVKVKQRTKELTEAQNRLLKSERLATIGEIAAMVGHDLRNPLTGIAGATYYLKMKSSPKIGKKTREMLDLIEEDIEYSNKIINDLLEYSREMQLELTEATPRIIMKEALFLVKVPKNIQVLDLTQTEPKINVDAKKTKRVFVNIIRNAIDAMSKGGKLTIKSKKIDGNLEIAFIDTGIGMPKDIVEKLWTPLFTTKAKGMGLGLAICKRVTEAHGGNISAESTVGKGTTFTVTIPIKPRLEGGEKIWVNIPESLLSTMTRA